MHAEVDPDVCSLSGYCARTSPALFALGKAHAEVLVDTIPPNLHEAALEAEAICPTAAIRVYEE